MGGASLVRFSLPASPCQIDTLIIPLCAVWQDMSPSSHHIPQQRLPLGRISDRLRCHDFACRWHPSRAACFSWLLCFCTAPAQHASLVSAQTMRLPPSLRPPLARRMVTPPHPISSQRHVSSLDRSAAGGVDGNRTGWYVPVVLQGNFLSLIFPFSPSLLPGKHRCPDNPSRLHALDTPCSVDTRPGPHFSNGSHLRLYCCTGRLNGQQRR